MKNYIIELEGCDASTYFKSSLTDMERDLVIKLCRLANEASQCGCEPRMLIYIDEGYTIEPYNNDHIPREKDLSGTPWK